MVELHARFSCTAIAATCALAGLEVRPRGSTHARIKFYDPPGNVYVVEKSVNNNEERGASIRAERQLAILPDVVS